MITTEYVNIKIRKRTLKHYTNLGYIVNISDIINIPIEHIVYGSTCIIKAKCDINNEEKEMQYRTYYNITNGLTEKYYCKYCAKIKGKLTNLERYGVENVFQNKEIRDRADNTILERYGVKYATQNIDITKKTKQTNLEKYGVEYVSQVTEFKEKMKQTNLERYGTITPAQNSIILEKMKQTRIERKIQIPDDKLTEYELYKRTVENITNRNKKVLYDGWDGYDYYDGEYIKNYTSLKSSDKKYPTIDHKTSTFYGFLNGVEAVDIADISNLCITKNPNIF